ncbi:MAG: hypothetical protein EOO09_19915 [Chitinophagaceae bacterium]|nr:MAG: hypothetical protein EOO09_19915 [Chitinophagaceae bacterium]
MPATFLIRLYAVVLSCLIIPSARSQYASKIDFSAGQVFAGIEVGSKGVKMSVIELKKKSFAVVKDTSVNTDFISFSLQTSTATLEGLSGLFNTALTEFGIPSDRIYTVISSGVKMQADKDNQQQQIDKLIGGFRERIKEPNRKVDVVDVTQEARLSHLGIVPATRRYTTFLIDIGSGNSKGGYFPSGNTANFRLFQLNWGTKSVANATNKRIDEFDQTISNYNRQLSRVLSAIETEDIIYSINASGAFAMSDHIAFSGGIAWAVATLLHPEQAEQSSVGVTFSELVSFGERLAINFRTVSDTALLRTTQGLSDPQAAAREIRRVHNVFDQRSLMAGTGLLIKIMRQFSSIYETKQFVFIKNGQVGWISAYVDQQTESQ